jgi:TPR repeat protein
MEACTILGSMYYAAQGVERDLARAVSLHERACEGGELVGCESLGVMYENGAGVLLDYPRAANLYQEACGGGLPSSCNRIGMMLQTGNGVPANSEQAVEQFARACDGGNFEGCVNLGVGYERGEGIAQDPSMAFALYEYACDNGEMLGCVNLGSLHRTGFGIPQDPRVAVSLYRRACDAGEALGCFNLGTSYEGGVGVPQDVVTAVASFQRACAAGLQIGCERLPDTARDQSQPIDSSVVATFGRVADAETEEPIQNAIVDITELGIRLVTDEDGRVDLPDLPVGRYTIRAEAAGFSVTEGALRVPGEADFLVLLEHGLVADADAPGRLIGRITDEEGRIVTDVDVNIVNRLTGRAISNQQGRFVIDDIAPGLAEVRFERLGYEPRTSSVVVHPGRTLEVAAQMSTEPIPLEPIQVVTVRSEYLERTGFYDRGVRHWGTQLGPEELENLVFERPSDLVNQIPGIALQNTRSVGRKPDIVSRQRYGATEAGCALDIYLDGQRIVDFNVDDIPPNQLEAVEVFQGLDVPIQFRRQSSQTGCGVFLMWTRRGA